jgi:hypothetical protein
MSTEYFIRSSTEESCRLADGQTFHVLGTKTHTSKQILHELRECNIVFFWIVAMCSLCEDADVSEEHTAPIFRIEVCRFRNGHGYMGELKGRCLWGPRGGGKESNEVKTNRKK